MCGVSGVVCRYGLTAADRDSARRMHEATAHRGPDSEGFIESSHALVSMQRLSVVDPENGDQPFFSEDGMIGAVFNGEIYNWRDLRRVAEGHGHTLRSAGDGEVIPHLYEQFGDMFVRKLRGMFAIVLVDLHKGRVLFVRDRLGEKPLYLYRRGDTLFFCSELRGLLASRAVPLALDGAAVQELLLYSWIPEPRTAIEGVMKLPAASYLSVDLENWEFSTTRYWSPLEPSSRETIEVTLRETIEEAVSATLHADVPIAIALSGGLDSSLVACRAVASGTKDLQAITVGYSSIQSTDERVWSRRLARDLRLPLHEIVVSDDEAISGFPRVVALRDDPIADIAGYNYLRLAMAARELGCPVLLQGQGGDELFWGYPWVARRAQAASLTKGLRGSALLAALVVWSAETHGSQSWMELIGRLRTLRHIRGLAGELGVVASGSTSARRLHESSHDFASLASTLPRLESDHVLGLGPTHDPFASLELASWGQSLDIDPADHMVAIMAGYLRENGLTQSDRLAMSQGIETRLPLVDYKVVEKAIYLARSQPIHGQIDKRLLKRALKGLVPDYILRRKKQGFAPPTQSWLSGIAKQYGERLIGGNLAGAGLLLNPDAVLADLAGTPGVVHPLWFRLLTLEMWMDGLEGESSPCLA